MLHISDWYPTILQIANFEETFDENDIDGIDQYEAIFPVTNNDKASIPPSEVFLVPDPKSHQHFYWIRINVINCIRNPTDTVSINKVPYQPDPDLNDFALRIHLSEPA